MTELPRRRFLRLATGVVALPAASHIAWARTYPSRSITMIVPFAAGGPTDVSARIVAEHMSRTLGQQMTNHTFRPLGDTRTPNPCSTVSQTSSRFGPGAFRCSMIFGASFLFIHRMMNEETPLCHGASCGGLQRNLLGP
jgi:hypothetical protein